MNRTIEWLVRACAIVGGVVVVAITLVTTVSILGRWLFNAPLLGDTEVVEYGMAIVVASYLPICMWRGANIIVDFFTAKASERTQTALDRVGYLVVGLMLGLIAWRTLVGAIDQKSTGTVTMLLQWPEWVAYASMALPLALAAFIGLYMAVTGRTGRE